MNVKMKEESLTNFQILCVVLNKIHKRREVMKDLYDSIKSRDNYDEREMEERYGRWLGLNEAFDIIYEEINNLKQK